ncbi:hypothetical protein B0H10DRAFT_2198366 [Mycena sp. CBHHK59/15]|nr:hypothetical protein B0H10DRAFT_2198366 [Mycena sp. CBHHK59/15]
MSRVCLILSCINFGWHFAPTSRFTAPTSTFLTMLHHTQLPTTATFIPATFTPEQIDNPTAADLSALRKLLSEPGLAIPHREAPTDKALKISTGLSPFDAYVLTLPEAPVPTPLYVVGGHMPTRRNGFFKRILSRASKMATEEDFGY